MSTRVPGPSKSLSEGDLNGLLHPVSPSMSGQAGPASPPDKLNLHSTGTQIGETNAGKYTGSGNSPIGSSMPK